MEAAHHARTLPPISDTDASFDVASAYAVLHEIHARRTAMGWRRVGRKIGFTNRTLWERYGVDRPMWASVFAETVQRAPTGRHTLSLSGLVQPRIEPEVVFGLRGPVTNASSARTALDAVEWIAAGFELVQCHFPNWRFRAPDCTAAFGLHGALVVGQPKPLVDAERDRLAGVLAEFELSLFRDGSEVDRGRGSDVLGSPALALAALAQLLDTQPEAPRLRAGEIVTTGTLTDAWPIAAGAEWRADYGVLGLEPVTLRIA